MSASPMPAVDMHSVSESELLERPVTPTGSTLAETAVDPVAPAGRQAGQGVLGAIRDRTFGLADFFTRLKTAMVEVDSLYKETWNGGRPGARAVADVRIPHSTPAMILSESGEVLAEGTLREDAEGGALLRLNAPRPLPVKAIVRTPQDETDRVAKVKWTGETSAILEFET